MLKMELDDEEERHDEEEEEEEEELGLPAVNTSPKYRECLKNHAVGLGGHALDGCGEFLAAGPEGSIDALKCAACSCHRNFHRKHISFPLYRHAPPSGYLHVSRPPPPPHLRQLALPSSSGDGGRKRFRTKFTAEQKERMAELAERLGWRIQKHDEDLVRAFCDHTGLNRQVLKVWMHNNKHNLGKKLLLP